MYSICIIISDRPLLFWLLLCSHSIIIIFLVKKRRPLFGNPIAMKYEVIVIVYQLTLENGFSANFTVAI